MDETKDKSNQTNGTEHPVQESGMHQTPAEEAVRQTKSARPKATTRKIVMNAIRLLKNPKGSSFADIKRFVSSRNDAMDLQSLKLFLANAVNGGILMKVDGKYKVKESARRKRSSSKKLPSRRKRKSASSPRRRKSRSKKQSSGQKTARKRSPRKKRRSKKLQAAGQ